jgi:predicted acetyltransferase
METRPARPSERDEVLDLLAHWFDNRDFFARYNQNDPAFRDELCLVAADAGRIVSTVQIFDRKVNLDGQAVRMGGIGSVYTLSEYRKQGIASALMKLSLETMERQGFELSLLFAERLDFYGGFGWRSVTRTFSVLPSLDRIKADERFSIERLTGRAISIGSRRFTPPTAGASTQPWCVIPPTGAATYTTPAIPANTSWYAALGAVTSLPMPER